MMDMDLMGGFEVKKQMNKREVEPLLLVLFNFGLQRQRNTLNIFLSVN
jgi:hypothetical protein